MICDVDKLIAYTQGELRVDEAAILREHLETCGPCRQYVAAVERLEMCLRESLSVPENAPSLTDSVMAGLPAVPHAGQSPRRMKTWAMRLGISAATAALVFAAWLGYRGHEPIGTKAPERRVLVSPSPKPAEPERRPAVGQVRPALPRFAMSEQWQFGAASPCALGPRNDIDNSSPCAWELRSGGNTVERKDEVVVVLDDQGNKDVFVRGPASIGSPIDLFDLDARFGPEPRPAEDSHLSERSKDYDEFERDSLPPDEDRG